MKIIIKINIIMLILCLSMFWVRLIMVWRLMNRYLLNFKVFMVVIWEWDFFKKSVKGMLSSNR